MKSRKTQNLGLIIVKYSYVMKDKKYYDFKKEQSLLDASAINLNILYPKELRLLDSQEFNYATP